MSVCMCVHRLISAQCVLQDCSLCSQLYLSKPEDAVLPNVRVSLHQPSSDHPFRKEQRFGDGASPLLLTPHTLRHTLCEAGTSVGLQQVTELQRPKLLPHTVNRRLHVF